MADHGARRDIRSFGPGPVSAACACQPAAGLPTRHNHRSEIAHLKTARNYHARSAPSRSALASDAHSGILVSVLARTHLSLVGTELMASKNPELSRLDNVVAPQILDAMRVASAELSRLGIRHLLVGGLAVGAWGYPRATKNVDFLVGHEAYEQHAGGLVTMKPGAPIQVGGVAIDFLSPRSGEAQMEQALDRAGAIGVSVAPLEVLIHLKLKSPRQKDLADIVELIKAGLDARAVEAYVAASVPDLLPRWNLAVSSARAEETDT